MISRLCSCSGCRPAATLKRTMVCWACRYMARVTASTRASFKAQEEDPRLRPLPYPGEPPHEERRPWPVCPRGHGPMQALPLTAKVPSPKHERAWRKLERRYRKEM